MKIIRYKCLLIVGFLSLTFGFNIVDAEVNSNYLSLLGKVITVDPGHGR